MMVCIMLAQTLGKFIACEAIPPDDRKNVDVLLEVLSRTTDADHLELGRIQHRQRSSVFHPSPDGLDVLTTAERKAVLAAESLAIQLRSDMIQAAQQRQGLERRTSALGVQSVRASVSSAAGRAQPLLGVATRT